MPRRLQKYWKSEDRSMKRAKLVLKLFVLLTVSLVCLCLGHREASAQEFVYQTKLTEIKYHHSYQLEEFAKKIRPCAFNRMLDRIFIGEGAISTSAALDEFVDSLFQKVQAVLDMPQPRLKVTIRLLKDRKDLSEAYAHSMASAKGSTLRTKTYRKAPLAFYWEKTNTIYLQIEKLSIGILAHEMAHAVIDHYFVVRPPAKIAEMLCQYVDRQISSRNL